MDFLNYSVDIELIGAMYVKEQIGIGLPLFCFFCHLLVLLVSSLFVCLIDIHQVGEVADRDGPGRRVVGDSPIQCLLVCCVPGWWATSRSLI